jgi:poly-gamma-glutamate synthesis protein (capsule biosynthesis protein)
VDRLVPTLLLLLLLASVPPVFAQAPRELRLTFAGDIMAHDVNYLMDDYRDIYAGVGDLLLIDDLTFANLELPVDPARPESGYPLFNGSASYVRAAVDSGIDVFSTANNHAFDGGVEGVFQTLRVLESLRSRPGSRVAFSGTRGNSVAPFLPARISVGELQVGFLALSQFLNVRDGGRYVNVVDDADPVAVDALLRFVKRVSGTYDAFVISYHGDAEYVRSPASAKKAFFRALLEAGATVVFGHHPHVVQPYEVVRVGDTDRLIMYSMGNFISGMSWRMDPSSPDPVAAATGEGLLLRVDLSCWNGACSVSRVRPVLIANYRDRKGHMVVGKLDELASGAAGLPAIWTAYFAERRARLERFFATPQAALRGGQAP